MTLAKHVCYYCLGSHQSSQCLSLAVRETTREITAGQQAAARATTEAIESLGYRTLDQLAELGFELVEGLAEVRTAIEGLHNFLSWAHSEVIWRMEKQIELLTGIHNMMKHPSATQANELYGMGVDSYKRQRLGDALNVLHRARDLNPGDYRILITLGHTYVQMDNLTEAAECFAAAADYARTNDYKKDALLLLSRAFRCLERVDEAVSAAQKAASVAPHDSSAHYELAASIAQRLAGPPKAG